MTRLRSKLRCERITAEGADDNRTGQASTIERGVVDTGLHHSSDGERAAFYLPYLKPGMWGIY